MAKSRRAFVPNMKPGVNNKTWGSTPQPLLPPSDIAPDWNVYERNPLPQSPNMKRVQITKVIKWLDVNRPGWRGHIVNTARETARDFASSLGNAGLRKVESWYNTTFGGGNTSGGMIKSKPSGSPIGPSSKDWDAKPVFRLGSNTSYALSPAPNPKPVKLNSGIRPNTFVNDYMTPMVNSCSPLHMSLVSLQVPTIATASTNPLATYFEKNIVFDIRTLAQSNLDFALDGTIFTDANVASAINDAIYALQVYFQYSSILSYDSDSKNRNSGMTALRNLIDVPTLSDWVQLGKKLEDLPLPPRLVDWVKYMNGNFLASNSPGSPIIKIGIHYSTILGTPASTYPAAAIARVVQGQNNYIWTVMRKAKKAWRVGKLTDVPPTPVYDPNFVTIFSNLPNGAKPAAVVVNGNTVANTTTAIPYNTFSNHLDGLAFAMGGMYNSTDTLWYPGLVGVSSGVSTSLDSRYSYYEVGGTKNFYPVISYPYLASCRQETVANFGSTTYLPHLFGADKCQNVTGNSLLQSAQSTLDFLFMSSPTYSRFDKYVTMN